MNGKPLVTVCLVAYNQRDYIVKCADSLLMQETSFPYLILAHDDASTDGTAQILSEYEKKYPEKFRLIAEKENTYSKDTRVMARRMWPLIESPFTAVCEGDDYWTDPFKLEKQVTFLVEHPEYSFSVTGAQTVNSEGDPVGSIAPYSEDTDMPVEDLISGGGGYIATASVVTRTQLLKELPEYYFRSTVGDAPLQLYLASVGKTRWHAEKMCAYRVNAKGSWTVSQLTGNTQKYIRFHESMVEMLSGFDEATEGRWHAETARACAHHRFEAARLRCDTGTMRAPENEVWWNRMSTAEKCRVYLMKYCPAVIGFYRRLRFGKKV